MFGLMAALKSAFPNDKTMTKITLLEIISRTAKNYSNKPSQYFCKKQTILVINNQRKRGGGGETQDWEFGDVEFNFCLYQQGTMATVKRSA